MHVLWSIVDLLKAATVDGFYDKSRHSGTTRTAQKTLHQIHDRHVVTKVKKRRSKKKVLESYPLPCTSLYILLLHFVLLFGRRRRSTFACRRRRCHGRRFAQKGGILWRTGCAISERVLVVKLANYVASGCRNRSPL